METRIYLRVFCFYHGNFVFWSTTNVFDGIEQKCLMRSNKFYELEAIKFFNFEKAQIVTFDEANEMENEGCETGVMAAFRLLLKESD